MPAGLALYVTFAVRQCTKLQPQPYYEVYDSDEYAQARFFLIDHMETPPPPPAELEPPPPPPIFESPPLPPPMLASPPPPPLSSSPGTSRKLQSLADHDWSAFPVAHWPDPGLDRMLPHSRLSHAEGAGNEHSVGHARHLLTTNTNTTTPSTEPGGPNRWELSKNSTGDVLCVCCHELTLHSPLKCDTELKCWQPPLSLLELCCRLSAIPSVC